MTLNVERIREREQASSTNVSSFNDTITVSNDPLSNIDNLTEANIADLTSELETEGLATVDRLIQEGEVIIDSQNGEQLAPVPTPSSEEPEQPQEESAKSIRRRVRAENPSRYKRDAKRILEEKQGDQKFHLAQIMRPSQLRDVKISSKDLIFAIIDGRTYPIYTNVVDRDLNLNEGFGNMLAQSSFNYDKNLNILIPIDSLHSTNRTVIRNSPYKIFVDQLPSRRNISLYTRRYVILDREKFEQSNGRIWAIKHRSRTSISEVLKMKRRFIRETNHIERLRDFLVPIIAQYYPEDQFEIIFVRNKSEIHFYITILFKDVTIRNSYELTHHIGNIVVRSEGVSEMIGNTMHVRMTGGIAGKRLTYVPIDLIRGYSHSHLTSGSTNSFSSFCTGSISYSTNYNSSIDDTIMDIEEHLLKLSEFISWESLEGGPHIRMEDILTRGRNIVGQIGLLNQQGKLHRSYISTVVEHIKKQGGFSVFESCFKLKNMGNNLTFIADTPKFNQKMVELFDNNAVRKISDLYDEQLHTYDADRNQYYKFNTSGIITDVKTLNRKALRKTYDISPVYINGKLYRCTVDTSGTENPMDEIRLCIDPDLTYEIQQMILYHLIEKLEKHDSESK